MKDQTVAKHVCVLVAGLYIGLLSDQSALAVTIKNGVTTIFMDDFENDTLLTVPMISGADIGSRLTKALLLPRKRTSRTIPSRKRWNRELDST